ncbi:hypothetical protein Droror1_Dr00017286 [Drosera rotundifolia]
MYPMLRSSSNYWCFCSCYCCYRHRVIGMTKLVPRASLATAVEEGKAGENDDIPTPKVIVDQDSDPNATVVKITFGDRLGTLFDTMNALKNLGLNVVKENVFLDSFEKHNTFAITNPWNEDCTVLNGSYNVQIEVGIIEWNAKGQLTRLRIAYHLAMYNALD